MIVSHRHDLAPRALALGGIAAGASLAFAGAVGSAVALAAVIAAVSALAVIVAPWAGVVGLLFLAATDGFIKHLAPSAVSYTLKDALLALILVGVVVHVGSSRERVLVPGRWRGTIPWALFVALVATQLAHPFAGVAQALAALRAHALFAMLFVVGGVLLARRDRFIATANIAIVVAVVAASGALLQHVLGTRWNALGPGFALASAHYASLVPEGSNPGGAISYRMYGTLVDPAALGLACSYGLLAAFAALPRLRGGAKLGTIAAIPVIGLALLESQTRAAVIGLGVGLVVVVTLQLTRPETRRSVLIGLVLVLLAVPAGIVTTNGAILKRFASHDTIAYAAATRYRSAARTVDDVTEFPLGHGMGATGAGGALRAVSGLAVDNTYYSYLYETGIPGLAAFMIVQLAFLLLGLRAAVRTNDVGVRTAYIGVLAGQVSLLCAAWFTQGAFDYAPLAQQFWLFAGALARQETLA